VFFRNLVTERCGRCEASAPKSKENWCCCPNCGLIYEFLETDKPCGKCTTPVPAMASKPPEICKHMLLPLYGALFLTHISISPYAASHPESFSGTQAVQYAMAHPVDPRTHSNHGTPMYRNPYIEPMSAYNRDREEEVNIIHPFELKP